MLTVHLFCDSRRYINSSSSSSISKNVDSQDVALWLVVVVVVVGGLAAGQLGLLVTSSSLAWPGLAAWTLLIPAEITFIRSQRLPIISQLLPGNNEESDQIIHVFRRDFTVVPLVFVRHFSRFCFHWTSDIYTQEYSMGSFVITWMWHKAPSVQLITYNTQNYTTVSILKPQVIPCGVFLVWPLIMSVTSVLILSVTPRNTLDSVTPCNTPRCNIPRIPP